MSLAPDLNVLRCPQCNAPITPPSRFARSAVCGFCGSTVQVDPSSVRSSRFKEAFREQNVRPVGALTLGNAHWLPGPLLAHGEISDVYFADRTRAPSERVLLKVLRDDRDAPLFEQEWKVLSDLQRTLAAATLMRRIPEPVVHGKISEGPNAGRMALAFGYERGFDHTVEAVQRAHPNGINPRAATWVWRRLLETLTFLHRSGFAHGAVLPNHLLIERNEHGLRLVGFTCAVPLGGPLNLIVERFEPFYPREMRERHHASAESDLRMAARCIASLLGGDPSTGKVPDSVPSSLAEYLRDCASDDSTRRDAWAQRQDVGSIASRVFGAPSFNPISMP
ncbi:MAG: hypothetical protein ACJ790_21255 [Myxococcaceae bacterium]